MLLNGQCTRRSAAWILLLACLAQAALATGEIDPNEFTTELPHGVTVSRLDTTRGPWGSVENVKFSPDGDVVVFVGDFEVDGQFKYYEAPADGSSGPVPIPGPLYNRNGGRPSSKSYTFSADGAYLVLAHAGSLYRRSRHGSVETAFISSYHTAFVICDARRSVIFWNSKLWEAPLDGRTPPRLVSGAYEWNVRDAWSISPNCGWMVFRDFTEEIQAQSLVSGLPNWVVYRGDRETQRVSKPMVSSDSLHIVYSTPRPDGIHTLDIFSNPIDNSGDRNHLFGVGSVTDKEVRGWRLSDDGQFVVGDEVYLVPIDGSSAGWQIGDEVEWLEFAPVNGRLAFANEDKLQSLDPFSRTTVRWEGVGTPRSPTFTPDGQRLLYVNEQESRLCAVTLDNPAAPVELAVLAAGVIEGIGDNRVRVSPDGRRAVYYDLTDDGRVQLWAVPLDGTTPPWLISDGVARTGAVSTSDDAIVFAKSGTRIAYLGQTALDGPWQLFCRNTNLGGQSILISGSPEVLRTGLSSYEVTADGKHVVYTAYRHGGSRWYTDGFSTSLNSVVTDGKSPPLTLSTAVLQEYEVSPSGERVAFGRARQEGIAVTASLYEADISTAFSDRLVSEVAFDSEQGLVDARLGYIRFSPNERELFYGVGEYCLDCSDPDFCSPSPCETSIYLIGGDGATSEVWRFPYPNLSAYGPSVQFSDSGRYIGCVFDGSFYAANVSPPTMAYTLAQRVNDFSIKFGKDSSVYKSGTSCYAIGLSGETEPIPVVHPESGEPATQYEFADDGIHLAYAAGGDLFWGSVDGSEPPRLLQSEAGVRLISPDQGWVVFSKTGPDGIPHLYSVTTRGGQLAHVLSPAPEGRVSPYYSFNYVEISPDSRHVAYTLRTDFYDAGYLYSVAIDGSRPPVLLSDDPAHRRDYQFNADGSLLAYSKQESERWPVLFSLRCIAPEGSCILPMSNPERAVPYRWDLQWGGDGLIHTYYEESPELMDPGVGLYIANAKLISASWERFDHQSSSTNVLPVTYRLEFSERVSELEADDLVNYGSAKNVRFDVQPVSSQSWEVRVLAAQDGELQPGLPALRLQGDGGKYNARAILDDALVLDRQAPIVTVQGPLELLHSCGDELILPNANAEDPGRGGLTVNIDDSAVDIFTPGRYDVLYRAIDDAGNVGATSVSVFVVDELPPVMRLKDGAFVTVTCNTPFLDPGASAVDACAGEVAVAVEGAVDTSAPGSYVLTYTADDGHGNIATATREVVVADTAAPVLTLAGDALIRMRCGESFDDPGATAMDACAGALEVSVAGAVDTTQAGHYLLSYTATDPSGNTASVDRTVEVRCGCLLGSAELLYPRDGSLVNVSGAAAALSFMATVDCPDDTASAQFYLDGAPLGMPLIAPPFVEAANNIAASAEGTTHTVTIEVTDTAGGVISASSAFSVVQVTAQANGLPDLPLGELLPEDGDSYYGDGSVQDCTRLVGMIAWHGDVSGADPALELIAVDGTGVTVSTPRALLGEGERGILFVALGCDTADSALDQGADLLDIQPGEPEGAFVYTTVFVSTDAGASYAEIDPEHLNAQPLRYTYASGEKRALQAVVYTHPAATLFDPMALTGEIGAWVPQATTTDDALLEATLTAPGLSGIFRVDPLGPQIQVRPAPMYPYMAGIVPLGEAVDVPIEVTNIGTGILEGAVSIEGSAAFALLGETEYRLGPGEKLDPGTLTLRFAPATAGDHSATIRFTPPGDCIPCNATLTAHGTASATTPESYFNCNGGGRGASSRGDGLLMLAVLATLAGFARFRSRSGAF
jgi:Tol biopolymer transport system component